jgi:3-oxoacyl-[acyl-carrier-protein] synthase-3
MGMKNIGAFDLKAACSGFIYGLSVADQFIKSGVHEKILLVGAEAQSVAIKFDSEHRDLAVLFGDGAGAVVLQPSDDDTGVLSTHLHSDGSHVEDLWMPAPGSSFRPFISKEIIDDEKHIPYMNGREVFKNASIRFPEVIQEALTHNNLALEDIKLVIPHQANLRISQMVAKRLGVALEKIYSNIHRYGNTTAASIPIAMSEALDEGKFSQGDTIILAAFGSGFTWASAAIKW